MPIRRIVPAVSSALIALSLHASPSFAQSGYGQPVGFSGDLISCTNLTGDSIPDAPDVRIAACGRVIASQKETADNRRSAYIERGKLYQGKGDHARAVADFSEAIMMKLEDGKAYLLRCFSHKLLQQYDRAIADCGTSIARGNQLFLSHFHRGESHMMKGDLDNARKDLDIALNHNRVADVYMSRGRVYAMQNKLQMAIVDFSEGIALAPKAWELYFLRGEMYRMTGQDDLAFADLDMVTSLAPDYPSAYSSRAQIYGARREFERGLKEVDKAIRLDSDSPASSEAYAIRGMLHHENGATDKAMADYDLALLFNPKQHLAAFPRGRLFYEQKDYDQTIRDMDVVIAAIPNNVSAYDYRASAYYFKGDMDKALADYDMVVKMTPGNGQSLINRGVVYLEKGMPAEAVADLSKAVELGYSAALADLAEARIASEDLRAALTELDKLTQMSPDKEFVWRLRGNVQRYLGDERMVVADYERAVAIAPNIANKMLLWRAQARSGDQVAALRAFDAEHDKEPSTAAEYNLRCWYLLLLGAAERALVYCDRALALEPDYYAALDSRGLAHHALGRHDEALKDYDRALAVEPKGWSTYLRRSRLLEKMGAERSRVSADYKIASDGFGKDKRDQYFSHLETQDALLNTARLAGN
jgi:tetratricopeptide (TPR) repeat protein